MVSFLEEVNPVGKQAFLWKTEMLPGRQEGWLRDEEITVGASRKSVFITVYLL